MRVLLASYNIQYGLGQDERYDLTRAIEAVREADIICLQEVGQHWARNGEQDQVAVIARALNYYTVFGSTFDVDASFVDERGRVVNRRRTFGNLVASRWPIRSSRTLPLGKRPIHGAPDVQRCAVEAVVEVPGQAVRVYSVHLTHVSTGQRVPQISTLLEQVRSAPATGAAWDYVGESDNWVENRYDVSLPEPAIVAGDLNLTPAFPEYALLAGEWNERRGRLVPHDGLFDAWVLGGNEEQAGNSYATSDGTSARLDHVFVTPSLRQAVQRMWVDETVTASDHYPVYVELELGDTALTPGPSPA